MADSKEMPRRAVLARVLRYIRPHLAKLALSLLLALVIGRAHV